jgi:Domain of unknown function (DUF4132)/Family of unknown function (DUF5724)
MLKHLKNVYKKRNHQKIITAFAEVLPDEQDLDQLLESFGNTKVGKSNREAAYVQYALPVVNGLGKNAGQMIIDFLVNPKEHFIPYSPDRHLAQINIAATKLARTHVALNPSAASAESLMTRLKRILLNWQEHECRSLHGDDGKPHRDNFLYPRSDNCLKLLVSHLEQPGVPDFFYDIFSGKYNIRIEYPENPYSGYTDVCRDFLVFNMDTFDQAARLFFKENRFSYEFFDKAGRLYPDYIKIPRLFDEDASRDPNATADETFISVYREYTERLLLQLIEELPESDRELFEIAKWEAFSGLKWLEQGLGITEKFGLKAKDLRDIYSHSIGSTTRTLIDKWTLGSGEKERDAIRLLQQYKPSTLLLILPYAASIRDTVLKALGWEDFIPLQKILFNIAGRFCSITDNLEDVKNCADSNSGVVDRDGILKALEHIDEVRLNKYIKALQISSLSIKNTLMLLNAIRGVNRDNIEKKLVRHGQAAIKAYGLYAVENKEDLKQRYLRFKTMHKEAAQYGPERQTNTRAAVQAGLKNLAQTAGFSDEIRMEWHLEADISDTMVSFGAPEKIEDWTIRLVIEGVKPKIEIKGKKGMLKSVPKKVRSSDQYVAMRQTQDMIREQARRFRGTLENMMCSGEKIKTSEMNILARLPVASSVLKQLVFKTNGVFGLFSGDSDKLNGLDGKTIPISGDVQIAHVHHLFQAGVLPDWQKYTVNQRMVQPFKQVFRELYVVTPAEIDAVDRSSRFAGNVVDSAVTTRLLQSRGWIPFSSDVVEVYKSFSDQNVKAEVRFPDARHYLTEQPEVTIDEVYFWRKRRKLPLTEIDPITFSEVMRDVDLVASVAQVSEDDERWSSEMTTHRLQLIEAIISEIGFLNIQCKGHFAYITGKLANYRIHLGSGMIHIEPGNYLCVVPGLEDSTDKIYLPFSDTDKKMAEIISKIFLLAKDDTITDPSILRQIKRQ